MTVNDYIPLVAISAGEFRHQSPRAPRFRSRIRTVIFGAATIALLVFFSLVTKDFLDEEDDPYEDEYGLVAEYRAAYLPFQPSNLESSPSNAHLAPTQVLPENCLGDYISSGSLCYDSEIKPMDVVWAWVNGSDSLLQKAKLEVEGRYGEHDPYRPKTSAAQARQYRDHDELKHSMRSVLANFRPYTTKFHVLTSDFAVPTGDTVNLSLPPSWRLGQVPQWIDLSKKASVDGGVELSFIPHAQFFKPYHNAVFNSYAIESQFANLPNVSEHFVYLNDDFYISNPLTHRSFYTSVYGTVLRLDLAFMIPPHLSPDENRGEWKSMGESNTLLSNRFGARYRPYVVHEAKSASLSLMHEVTLMWPSKLSLAASHSFRETVSGAGDVSMLFLTAHFLVERWREALLWSWAVARLGGQEGVWDESFAQKSWREVGGGEGQGVVEVRAGRRKTLDQNRVTAYLKASGHKKTDKTSYVFSGLDGYPYMYVDDIYDSNRHWPSFESKVDKETLPTCTISYDECFRQDGTHFSQASDFFKHIAFQNIKCGDCMIQALVKSSGSLGLSSFLPPPSPDFSRLSPFSYPNAPKSTPSVPHLPLIDNWQEGNFSLEYVMRASLSSGEDVRQWTLRLLQRYRFVIGYTPFAFVMLDNPEGARGALGWIDSYRDASLLCINDDVTEGEDDVTEYFINWQEKRWGKPAAWER